MLKEIVCVGVLLAASAAVGTAQDSSGRIVQRYRELLRANPTQGTALDRLWKIYQERSATSELLGSYRDDATFSGRMLHGHLLRKAGQGDAAAEAYRQAASVDAESPLPHLALADLADAAGDPAESAAELGKACGLLAKDDPARPGALVKLGNAWAAAGDAARAAEAWERTVALDPSNVQLRIQLAQSYEGNDLPERAAMHYEFIVANGSAYERALAFRDLARVRQVLGDEDAAIAALERGIALTAPGNWLREALQAQLIRLHQRFGRTEELERKWQEAVARNPRDLGGYLQLVAFYRQLADLPQQRERLERLVEVAPRNLEYKGELAHVLTQLGDADAAANLYDAILAARPDDVEAGFTRAGIDIRRGSVREARARVEKVLAAHPDDGSVRAKARAFYAQHRLFDMWERHLRADAVDAEGVVALAQFYFDRDRESEARAALERLIDPTAALEDRAAANQRIAGIYRERNDLPRAIAAMERAAELQPGSSEVALALGSLYLSAGDLENAGNAVEIAYALAEAEGDPAKREEADRTLFQVFQTAASANPGDSTRGSAAAPLLDTKGRIRLFAVPPKTGSGRRQANISDELAEYIEKLTQLAEARNSPEAWLRVARWQIWARRSDLAMRANSEALEIDPGHVPAREMVVKIASADGLFVLAAAQLRELVQLDPENATRYRKQFADLKLANGDSAEALAIFRELAVANPGDPDRLADLALALERHGELDEALATWRKAYEMSAPPQRGSVLPPLLQILDKLGRNQEALGLLLAAVDAHEDDALRFDAFREMLSYATAYDLVEVLRRDFEARHRRRPNDYFTEMALAQILKAEGRAEESFELQRAAAFFSPNPLEAFEQLAAEAEALGRVDTAIEAQERLIALRSDDSPEALEDLAAMQERALDIQAAADTWRKLAARFPRDPEILRRAAAFFALWRFDDEATAALRSARVLEPRELRGLLQLADLARRSGREAEAQSCYDQILRFARPEKRAEIVVPNLPEEDRLGLKKDFLASLRSRSDVLKNETLRLVRNARQENSVQQLKDGEYRLAAIRGAATVLADAEFEAQRRGWLWEWDRNREGTPSERLWAFYFVGDRERTLGLLEERMVAEPENPYAKQAFIRLALEMKGYETLGRWLGDSARQPQDRDLMAIALGQYLSTNTGMLDPALASTVFPPAYRLRQMTWQAAVLFATAGHFAEAVRLGERVFAEAVANRATYGNELAYWYLIVGDTENARRILGDSIRARTGDSPDSPVFEALRRYVLLLPMDQRAAFIDKYTADPAHNAEPMHGAISRVLLFGIVRDEERVAEALRDLYALHGLSYAEHYDGSATYRAWSFIVAMGIQLQKWRLDGLAGALWERALSDPALARLAGRRASDVVRDLKVRLAANDLVTRNPTEGSVGLADFLAESSAELAPSLAATLESSGYPEFSIRIYREIWEANPNGLNHLRALVNACRAANATDVATDTLIDSMQSAMENAATASHPMIFRDAVLQFVDFLIGQEKYEDAERLLAAADDFMPQDALLLERQARVAKQRGNAAEAEQGYRTLLKLQPHNNQVRLLLAEVLDEQRKTKEAIALLEGANTSVGRQHFDAPLADLYLKDGQISRARAALRRLMRSNLHDAIPGLARSLSEKGYRREAQRVLYAIVQRSREEGDAFVWQAELLENLSPENEPDLYWRAVAQLQEMARTNPEHLPAYYEVRARLARRDGSQVGLRGELADEWSHGAGPFAAGAALAELAIDDGAFALLEETIGELLAHRAFDGALLGGLRVRLAEGGRSGLAAKVAARIAERMPLQTEEVFAYARALEIAGETSAASLELEKLARRAIIEPALAGRVGEALRKLGNEDAAARILKEAIRLDPYAVDYQSYVNYARLLIGRGELDEARRVLRYSFRNPANTEVEVIVDLLAAADRLRGAVDAISDFQLSPSNLRDFKRAARTRLAPTHTE